MVLIGKLYELYLEAEVCGNRINHFGNTKHRASPTINFLSLWILKHNLYCKYHTINSTPNSMISRSICIPAMPTFTIAEEGKESGKKKTNQQGKGASALRFLWIHAYDRQGSLFDLLPHLHVGRRFYWVADESYTSLL